MERKEPVLFLKFGRKCDLEALINGDIYTNNAKYFKDLEDSTENKECIGDKHEVRAQAIPGELKVYNSKKEVIFNITTANHVSFGYNGDAKKAMFCLYSLYEDDFKYDEKTGNYILDLSEEDKKYILEKFIEDDRDSVLLIYPTEIIPAINYYADKNNIGVINGNVKYYNYKTEGTKVLKDYYEKSIDRFFWKDEKYKKQREYRFVFSKEIEKGQVIFNIKDSLSKIPPISTKEFIEDLYVMVHSEE